MKFCTQASKEILIYTWMQMQIDYLLDSENFSSLQTVPSTTELFTSWLLIFQVENVDVI